jgi:aspartate kinase
MSSLIVAKFGGSSLADDKSFLTVRKRLERNTDMRVIVVSAPGKTKSPGPGAPVNGVKVTDRLLKIAEKARRNDPIEEDIEGVERIYRRIEEGLGMGSQISGRIRETVLERVGKLAEDDAPVAAIGEEFNAHLMADYLSAIGVKACYLDPADAGFLVSRVGNQNCVRDEDYPEIRRRVQDALDNGGRIVFPGFYGYDAEGAIRTFPRGGSDYTGAVLAAALHAGLYQNFTDTDGIRAVEPSVATDAPVIRTMTHRELIELTLGGKFGVFQYEAAVPLSIHRIPTQVLDTFEPASEGTYILPQVGSSERGITGIVHRGEFLAFEVVKYGIANVIGFFDSLLRPFGDAGISVEHAPSSTNDISVIVRKQSMESAGVGIAQLVARIRNATAPQDIKVHELSAVALVGEEVSRTPGLAKGIFTVLNEAGIEVPFHSHQGVSFILWLRNGDGQKAAKSLYEAYFKG